MIFRISLLLISLLTCVPAWSLGFGHVQVKSHLNEPLDLSIPLMLRDDERQGKFQVVLASPKEYQELEQNIPKSYPLLRVDTVDKNRALSVKVSSVQAIEESFLTIILKVQRGHGNFYKKIQVFLDPVWHKPSQRKGEPSEQIQRPPLSSKQLSSKQAVSSVHKFNVQKAAKQQALIALPASEWARRGSYGPVQSGDNLSEIAYRLRKDKRFSNHQVMLALFHSNPQAFENNNIDILKRGAFLQVPKEQEIRAFLQSSDFRDLESALKQKLKRKKASKPKASKPKQQPKSKFRGSVSLGMVESLDAVRSSINNAAVLRRLEKLEPLYEQVVASDIRIDGISGKVDHLAEEVRLLQQKVDALAEKGLVQNKSETNAGWWWFLALFIFNLLLLLIFFYRKQRTLWQEKLERIQFKHTYAEPKDKAEMPDADEMVQPEFVDDMLRHHTVSPSQEGDDLSFAKHPMDEDDESFPEMVQSDSANLVKEEPEAENLDEKTEKEFIDYPACFEVAIQKKDWSEAERFYQGMALSVQMQPRIQALYIQMLHQDGRVVDRNNALLNLHNTYNQVKWNRFCSLFDDDVWHQLQSERVIDFSGNVLVDGLEKSNIKAKEMEEMLAISDKEVLSTTEQESLSMKDDDVMDKTVIMDAKALAKWGESESSFGKEFKHDTHKPEYMDTDDVEKWGKVDEVTDDLALDVDLGKMLETDEVEMQEKDYTEIDIEFTGEIEAPLHDEASKEKSK
jgi:FimV-like protein